MELSKQKYYKKFLMFYLLNQWLFMIPLIIMATVIISILFFNSIIITLLFCFASLFLISPLKKVHHQKLLKRRENEFMIFIFSLSSLISIGKSF